MSVGKTRNLLIVPVFIPSQGCPFRCIYCDQEKITGQSKTSVDRDFVRQILDKAVESVRFSSRSRREVAFYGGTFTSLPITKMIELLEAVHPYLRQGLFESIRVSTRPDKIDKERLEFMKSFGVSTVELGAQSMDKEVLRLSKRGHTPGDTISSVHLLREYGYHVGIQLMPGLPGDCEDIFLRTIEKVINLRPDMVRLYPAIVIRGTELAKWYLEKRYQPLTLKNAVRLCQESCIRLEKEGIPVIRIGLMSSPSLLQEGFIVAGPWHTAFGFLVRSGIFQKRIEGYLPKAGEAAEIGIRVSGGEIPLVRGYKNQGLRLIEKKTGAKITYIKPDDSVPSMQIQVDRLDNDRD